MRLDRALEDTPQRPTRAAIFRRIAGLGAGALEAVRSATGFFRFEPQEDTDPELAELWLILLASDPDGTWYPWLGAVRRPKRDDADPTQ